MRRRSVAALIGALAMALTGVFALGAAARQERDASQDSATLVGHIVDSRGEGVPGVELFRLPTEHEGLGLRGKLVATTGEQGAFRAELASGPWSLRVVSVDHPDQLQQGTTEPGSVVDGLEFVLADGAEIRGRVSDAPLETLASLWVRAETLGRAAPSTGKSQPIAQAPRWARCSADGAFVLRGLETAARVRLSAHGEQAESYQRSLTAVVEARAGEDRVELVWQPETAVVFRVVDARTLEPVTSFEARIGHGFRTPILDDQGRTQLEFPGGRGRAGNLVPVAPQKLAIDALGHAELVIEVQPIAGREIDVGVLRVERAPVIDVLVQDSSTAAPIAGALVTLSEKNAEGSSATQPQSPWRRQRTDEHGRAQLNGLPGRVSVLRVLHEDYAPFEGEPSTSADGADVGERISLRSRKRR